MANSGVAALQVKSVELMEEAALVRAAQRGDADAFARLVQKYDQTVLRMAINLLRSPEDARDVYQEALLRVYRNLHSFRFDCSFSTWFYRIVSNICLDYLRRRKVRGEDTRTSQPADGERNLLDVLEESRADSDPQRRLLSAELREKIEQALTELSTRERIVFEMRHYQGLRLKAIGEALGTTEEAVKNCLFRATQKMRATLGEFA